MQLPDQTLSIAKCKHFCELEFCATFTAAISNSLLGNRCKYMSIWVVVFVKNGKYPFYKSSFKFQH